MTALRARVASGAVVLTTLALPLFGQASPGTAPIEVTYVANMGYLVAVGGEKILIDALFCDADDTYSAPTPEMCARMEAGASPFDGVKLVLATHRHSDHFQANAVASFLRSHPETVFLGTPQCVRDLEAGGAPLASIRARVRQLPVDMGTSHSERIDGIVVEAFPTDHDGGTGNTENVMFLVKMNGRVFFHEGDARITADEFAQLGLAGEAIDVAVLHEWYLTTVKGREILREHLEPRHVLVSHVPLRLQEHASERVEQLRSFFPETYLLKEPLEGVVFED